MELRTAPFAPRLACDHRWVAGTATLFIRRALHGDQWPQTPCRCRAHRRSPARPNPVPLPPLALSVPNGEAALEAANDANVDGALETTLQVPERPHSARLAHCSRQQLSKPLTTSLGLAQVQAVPLLRSAQGGLPLAQPVLKMQLGQGLRLPAQLWENNHTYWTLLRITLVFVACSEWLTQQAEKTTSMVDYGGRSPAPPPRRPCEGHCR